MAFDEARQGQTPAQFDHFGVRADAGRDGCIIAHFGDAVAVDGDGLNSSQVCIHRDHLAAAQNEVGELGSWRLSGWLRPASGAGEGRQHDGRQSRRR